MFIIFQTDDISILKNILNYIQQTVDSNDWRELDIPTNAPKFLLNVSSSAEDTKALNIAEEKQRLAKTEEDSEATLIKEFKIRLF